MVLIENPSFFFFDDVEHYFVPMVRAIGSDLGLFHWPSLTLRSWAAGYLDAEQVLGHFNPLNRLLYHWMAQQDDFRLAAAVYALVHLGLIYIATYLAARAVDASPGAATVAAFAMATNNLIVYWYAISWWNILASLPWFIFAIYARMAKATPSLRLVGVALACYLAVAAAAVHTIIALGVFLVLLDLFDLRNKRPVFPALIGTCGLAIGLLLSAHAWLPLVEYLPHTARASVHEKSDALSAQLGDLLQVAYPMFRPNLVVFTAYARAAVPIYFIGWFVTTLLITASSRRWRDVLETQWPLLVAGLFFLIASQGPEMLGPMRFAFRFMPFWMFATLLITARLSTRRQDSAPSPRRSWIAVAVAAYALVYSYQRDAGSLDVLTLALWSAAVAALIFRKVESDNRLWMFCLLGSVCFFIQTHSWWLTNANLSNWQTPTSSDAYRQAEAKSGNDYSLYVVPSALIHEDDFFNELSSGNTALNSGRNLVFGYTPTGHAVFNRHFCMFFFGWVCERSIDRALERDATTGVRLVDLMRVSEVVTTSKMGSRFAAVVPTNEWVEVTDEGRTQSRRWIRHPARRALPGSVSWAADSLMLDAVPADLSAERERYSMGERSSPSEVVFARLYLNGYELRMDGVPLPMHPLHGFLLAATLPPGPPGFLELVFIDPSRNAGRVLAVLGLLGLIGLGWAMRTRPQRDVTRQGPDWRASPS